MTLTVQWTAEAESSFAEIITHLERNWSEKEISRFIQKTNSVLKQIAEFPYMYEASQSRPGVRKGFITKQCALFYEVKQDHIALLSFWDNRRKPRISN
ncbi:type II toxin-antitoxin system RelE/ParE family toxin [Dyadobacter sp. CY343]|uniref:type II toxin-antitoxin system RelE/ParE family toxin n=1 Tax=Dyadobacter sp. CY343 TaxID=2907299 RepID=UPI0038D401B3